MPRPTDEKMAEIEALAEKSLVDCKVWRASNAAALVADAADAKSKGDAMASIKACSDLVVGAPASPTGIE